MSDEHLNIQRRASETVEGAVGGIPVLWRWVRISCPFWVSVDCPGERPPAPSSFRMLIYSFGVVTHARDGNILFDWRFLFLTETEGHVQSQVSGLNLGQLSSGSATQNHAGKKCLCYVLTYRSDITLRRCELWGGRRPSAPGEVAD